MLFGDFNSRDFLTSGTHCFPQTLEAPADFTILQSLAKCEHTPHTWALAHIDYSMDIDERIELIDRILQRLNSEDVGTVPELLDGTHQFPKMNSEQDRKYRVIEREIERFDIAEMVESGDKTAFGYHFYSITPNGIELILQKQSSRMLYTQEMNIKSTDELIKKLNLDKLQYEQTIREQDQRIRDLTEKTKTQQIFKHYWWLLVTFFGLGYAIAEFLDLNLF